MQGNIINRIMEQLLQPVPVVKMGATKLLHSDRHAYTVIAISKDTVTVTYDVAFEDGHTGEVTRTYPRFIIASRDDVKVIKGSTQDGSAEYEYKTTWKDVETFIFHKPTGKYRLESIVYNKTKGQYVHTNRTSVDQPVLHLGVREEYYDPSF